MCCACMHACEIRSAALLQRPRSCRQPAPRRLLPHTALTLPHAPALPTHAHSSLPHLLPHPAGFDMGAVVPVAEPEWSGAHHGLCLYASRVLQAVWDEQVGGWSCVALCCAMPP